MNTQSARVAAVDRLSFTVFLALAIHALIIFGVSFSSERNNSASPTLDVTLSQYTTDDDIENDDADFLADSNQQGSGTLEDKAQLRTTEQANIEDNQIFHTTPTIQQISFAELTVTNDRIISTTDQSDNSVNSQSEEDGTIDKPVTTEQATILNSTTDIATLKAMLDDRRQSYANRPRVRTLTAESTKRAVDANYIHGWLGKVERIGNQNYPEAARNQRMSGTVRLAVSINADGSLRSVTVTSSSGHSLLDQAAKQIVYLSAPYPEFSAAMLEEYDVLEIIRSWQFRVDNSFGVTNDD